MATGTEELNFLFDFYLINVNLNSHIGQVATIMDSKGQTNH